MKRTNSNPVVSRQVYHAETSTGAMETLHHTGVFQKQPVERMIKSFARELCGVLRRRTRVTLESNEAETTLMFLTGDVTVSIHITEGRMRI